MKNENFNFILGSFKYHKDPSSKSFNWLIILMVKCWIIVVIKILIIRATLKIIQEENKS